MAQDFERYIQRNVGTSAATVHTSNSDDAIISIRCANTTTSTINVDVFINDGSNDYYIIKNCPIVSGGSLELIDGGSRIVMKSTLWNFYLQSMIMSFLIQKLPK